MPKRIYFIAPASVLETVMGSLIVGNIEDQRKSLDGSLMVGKISAEHSSQFEAGEGVGEFTQEQVVEFMAANSVTTYTDQDVLIQLNSPQWQKEF